MGNKITTVFLIFLVVGFLATSGFLVYIQIYQPNRLTNQARQDPILLDPSFTKDGYIKLLGVSTTERIYSSRAYVRGKVITWEGNTVNVQIGTSQKVIPL